ncbi:MAG: response regulator [Bacteroidota bacterium]
MLNLVKTKFLLADDDSDDADIFCEVLTSIDPTIQCNTVENGRGVFEFLKNQPHKPDVIFIDINMPIMNGWECLEALKADSSYKDIPAVIYSTSSAKKDIDTAYRLGAPVFSQQT